MAELVHRQRFDCVLFGGYAGGTVGDEIALAVAIDRARADFGDNFAVLTRNPEYTGRLFPGVRLVAYNPRPRIRSRVDRLASRFRRVPDSFEYTPSGQDSVEDARAEWVEAVKNSRAMYLVGGGYLNDVWETSFSLLPIWIASEAGVPISSAPVQIGPFTSQETLERVVRVLRPARIKTRDRTSLELARRHGLDADGQPDDVFAVRSVLPEAGLRAGDEAGRPRIGVCIFRQNGAPQPAFDDWWQRFLVRLAADSQAAVEGFPFHNYAGYDAADTIAAFERSGMRATVLSPPGDFREAVECLTRYDAIVTCRFHAALLACVLGVPAFAFASGPYYEAKLTAFWPEGVTAFTQISPAADPEAVADRLMAAVSAG